MQNLIKLLIVAFIFGGVIHENKAVADSLLSLSEDYFDFGEIELGDDDSDTLTIENTSEVKISITDIDLWGEFFDFDYYSNCYGELSPGDTCDIEVIFSPNSLGDLEATLEIEVDRNHTFEAYLEGIGVLED